MNESLAANPIPGIPEPALQQLFCVLLAEPSLHAVIDLCLEGPDLTHLQRMRLMAAVDDLLLPWQVDLVLRHEMPAELEAHLQRVGQCPWQQ